MKTKPSISPKRPAAKRTAGSLRRVVRARMTIHADGTASFHVRGYDFRFADMTIAVNGYLFAPVRHNTDLSDDGRKAVTEAVRFQHAPDIEIPPGGTARIIKLRVDA